MKDGEIVQIGSPEDIVTRPTDSYVADFVRGISKLKFLFAHSVMIPVEQFRSQDGKTTNIKACPQAHPDDNLDVLISLAIDHAQPTVIIDGGVPVGIVTKTALLRGIQGRA